MAYAVRSPEAPLPSGPYSQAIVVDKFVFLAGQRPVDPLTGEIPSEFARQVEQAVNNIQEVLRQVGADLSSVVKLTVYLADRDDFECLNDVFRARFVKPFPARTTVVVRLRDSLVELDAVAALPDQAPPRLVANREASPTLISRADVQ